MAGHDGEASEAERNLGSNATEAWLHLTVLLDL